MKEFDFVVPASTANLGPGFGVLGLALDMPYRVKVRESDVEGMVVERPGALLGTALDMRHDALLRSLRAATDRWSTKTPRGLSIVVEGIAPRDCGLGTNSADYAAGAGIALRYSNDLPAADDVLELLVSLGSDPGHGAAALVGGLAIAIHDVARARQSKFRILRAPIAPAWHCVVASPNVETTTAEGNRIVPATLPHGIVSRTSGRLAGLLRALETGDESMLAFCLVDESHVPFRLGVAPGIREAIEAATEAGAAGATISGHGPAIIALTTNSSKCERIAEAARAGFESAGTKSSSWICKPLEVGAMPTRPEH
ncbi:MAG: hypothetical protein KDB80_03150 [Planctomycetes bacterium]|nr:hypothetical protein [Planctomycetota bacterium]